MTVPATYGAIGHGKSTLPIFSTSTYNPGQALALIDPAQESVAGPWEKLSFPLIFQAIPIAPQGPLGNSAMDTRHSG